jgi:hypothetical protein
VHVERVQKWVMSALLLTTAFHFAAGLIILAGAVDRAGAKPGLLTISGIVGVLAMAGTLLINNRRPVSPWLLAGLLPTAVGWYFLYAR